MGAMLNTEQQDQKMRFLARLPLFVLFGALCACQVGDAVEEEQPVQEQPPAETQPTAPVGEPTRGAKPAETSTHDFEAASTGAVPPGFSARLSGKGRPPIWEVLNVPDAPSGSQVLAQTDADPTPSRFPVLVLESTTVRDVELSVAFKPISGRVDQAAGLVWRYQDPDNYYVVRANALEDNVVLYKMEGGRRSDLDIKNAGRTYGLDVEVPGGEWSELGVNVVGDLFTVSLDGTKLFEVEDETFRQAGRVGLWTKADSVTWFDELTVTVRDEGPGGPH